jgi:uncharacterized membrane protein YraQ (UPF0718 family)
MPVLPRSVILARLKLGLLAAVLIGLLFYYALDGTGWFPHSAEVGITARDNWFVGESKMSTSIPKQTGYALTDVECDDGPVHQVKVKFWGQEVQKGLSSIHWKCTRQQSGFECLETGGVPE